jgi:hypothetical protein
MVITVVGNLSMARNIIELHARLLDARTEILRKRPKECTIDFREVSDFGVNVVEMISCFMHWFEEYHPCGRVELLL